MQVLHSRMADDPDAAYRVDRSKCAFVQFTNKEQADTAIRFYLADSVY